MTKIDWVEFQSRTSWYNFDWGWLNKIVDWISTGIDSTSFLSGLMWLCFGLDRLLVGTDSVEFGLWPTRPNFDYFYYARSVEFQLGRLDQLSTKVDLVEFFYRPSWFIFYCVDSTKLLSILSRLSFDRR